MECPKILVLFYGYGSIIELAKNVAEGVKEVSKEVKIARVKEYFPEDIIKKFRINIDSVKDIPEASLSDLEWADGIIMGSPSRYGNLTGQLKLFLDQTAELWSRGALYGKPVGFFTEASTIHGGHESTILAMANFAYHHGMIIVPPGYGIKEISATTTGGGPYGATHLGSKKELDENEKAIARFLGKRVAEVAKKLRC